MAYVDQSIVARFRQLHETGCFVIPNPWDIGSALYLSHLGFRALATTSAGFAFSIGRPDGEGGVGLDEALAHIASIVAAVPDLPVNADFQSGYARDPEDVATNVERCLETGVAGLSIEDNSGAKRRHRSTRSASPWSGSRRRGVPSPRVEPALC